MRPSVTSPAFLELERVVRHLGEELAGFRRRALQAEARVRELEQALEAARAAGGGAPRAVPLADMPGSVAAGEEAPAPESSVEELRRENARLRERLEAARQRTREMLDRVRFLRQQQSQPESSR